MRQGLPEDAAVGAASNRFTQTAVRWKRKKNNKKNKEKSK
jgi:hypothetical protein